MFQVCFTLRGAEDETIYGITFDSVKSILEYKNSYRFGIPKTEVKCICDCPGAEDFCGANTDVCKENYIDEKDRTRDKVCYNWFRESQSNSGCTAFLSGSAEVCCSLALEPINTTIWRAIQLGTGVNRAVFTVRNLSDNDNENLKTEIDLESGHQITNPFDITISPPAISPPIEDGWYFGQDGGRSLWGGVDVNALSEYDLDKVGWYKMEKGTYYMNKDAILASFNVDVENCDKDEFHVTFNSKYSDRSLVEAVELTELHKSAVSSVKKDDSKRKVEVRFRHYGNVDMTLVLNTKYAVIQVYDFSTFEDFHAEVLMDRHSNHFINITIVDGEGTIHGNLTTGSNYEIFKINLPENSPKLSVVYKRVGMFCKKGSKALMCLWTGTNQKTYLCKNITCSEEALKKFELPGSELDYEKGEKMSIFSLSTWAKHLNPAEWFNGITNWKEGLILATEVIGVITLIGVVIKVLRVAGCLGKCWMCIFCRKKENDKDSVKEDEQNKESSLNGWLCCKFPLSSPKKKSTVHEYENIDHLDDIRPQLNDIQRSHSLQLELQDLMNYTDGATGRFVKQTRSLSEDRSLYSVRPLPYPEPFHREIMSQGSTSQYLEQITKSVQDMADSLQNFKVESDTKAEAYNCGSNTNIHSSPSYSNLMKSPLNFMPSPCHVSSLPHRTQGRRYSVQTSPPQLLSRTLRGLNEPLEQKLQRIQIDLRQYQKVLSDSRSNLTKT